MRTIRMLSSAVLVGAMAVVTPGGAASAAPPTTYTGVFDGVIDYTECTTGTPLVGAEASGTWSIMPKRTSTNGTAPSAKGTFHIRVNGLPHVSYVYPNMDPVGSTTDTLKVSGATGAGKLTVTLTGNDMTYTIAPYSYNGLSCESVTYPGHLTNS